VRHLLAFSSLISILLSACASATGDRAEPARDASAQSKEGTLVVFAAASLTEAFKEIGVAFEAENAGVTVKFNFAGSQTLRTQIEEGAPADIFASANDVQMNLLAADGMLAPDAPRIFLTNQLVVILPSDNPAAVGQLPDLAKPGVKLVLAAADVPAGLYARQALDKMNASFGADFKDRVLARIVSNEDNVQQVVTKIQLGEADAGIVYTSDVIAAPGLKTLEIPDQFNVVARYPIAALKHATNPGLAGRFADYVLSVEAQAVLQKWGFRPVN
jgi:molybdate transport system substrate-binding protein